MMIIIRGRNGNGKGSLWCFCLNKGVCLMDILMLFEYTVL